MAMLPDVSYTPYATSLKEQTGDITTLAQFEEGNILTKTCNYAESGDKYDDDSIMTQLLFEEEMDMMDSGYEFEDENMSTEMLEEICDGSKFHPSVNRREAR